MYEWHGGGTNGAAYARIASGVLTQSALCGFGSARSQIVIAMRDGAGDAGRLRMPRP
jgi:hypothetical protein